jgi:hypothetical protein
MGVYLPQNLLCRTEAKLCLSLAICLTQNSRVTVCWGVAIIESMGGYVAPTSHGALIHLVLDNVATIDPVLGASLVAPNSQCLLESLVGHFCGTLLHCLGWWASLVFLSPHEYVGILC